ncbi:MAG: hypothetical protein HYX51_11140 [Chloroflexi bacterium]|nr:hypothetical protein [Chloroflexota bacterium]
MIVRVMGEGQFEIGGAVLDKLNEVDNQIVAAIEGNDEKQFAMLMVQMHDIICKDGKPVPIDEIVESDFILPPPDCSMDEVREIFTGEGMIPG